MLWPVPMVLSLNNILSLELIAVGQPSTALQLLHEAVMSKWLQHNMSVLEAVMLKFIDLCVLLRRGRTAKDGLHQFRGACQSVNIQSLETVIKAFLGKGEERLVDAQARADKIALDQIEDLEGENVVDVSWLITSSSADDAKERTDREVVTPWLRFVWESYRIVLDICRHNAKLEGLYREIVEHAFSFCRKYQRKAEFRRLCEILRHHLGLIIKYPNQPNGVCLANPESHQLQLDIRFGQLGAATELELWQEAFRSIEDIHGLFISTRRSAKPVMVVTYYEKLCRIFLMSENYLFLAAVWHKLFVITKAQNRPEEEIQSAADIFVLSTLAIPLLKELNVTCSVPLEEQNIKLNRLSNFLGLSKVPSKESLLREIGTRNVLEFCSEDVKSIFSILAGEFTDAKEKLEALLLSFQKNAQTNSFVRPLYLNFVCLVFRFVSAQHKSIKFVRIHEMIDIMNVSGLEKFGLEQFILHGCKTKDFYIRIDHQSQSLIFERPCLQPELSDQTTTYEKNAWIEIAEQAELLSAMLNSDFGSKISNPERVYLICLKALDEEHKANLARKNLIERKKELLEARQLQCEQEEAKERSLKSQLEHEAEKTRLSEEAVRREKARLEQERDEICRIEARKREEEKLRQKEVAAQKQNLEKLAAIGKRLDHLERAFRQEEIALLNEDYERQKAIDLESYKERVALLKQQSKAKYDADMVLKARLNSMSNEYHEFLQNIRQRRLAIFEEQLRESKIKLEQAKLERQEKFRAEAEERKRLEEQCQERLQKEESAAQAKEAKSINDAAKSKTEATITSSSSGGVEVEKWQSKSVKAKLSQTSSVSMTGGWRRKE